MRPAPRRLLAGLLVAPLLLAGCGQGPAVEQPPRRTAAFDPALQRALPADVRRSGVLRVVTDASYAPASSFAPDGRTIVGFEPDLAEALERVLGVDLEFANADFDGLLDDLDEGRADLVMSAMTDTPGRERRADFVTYFAAGTAILVQRGNPAGISDLRGLCGRTVAVERGTVQVDLLRRSQRHCRGRRIAVRTFDTNADALVQLRTGRAAAVLNDYPPAAHVVREARTRARFQLASTAQYEPGLYGIAVRKDRPALRDALLTAVDRVIRSGEYADILERWGVADGGVDAASINAGGGAPAA